MSNDKEYVLDTMRRAGMSAAEGVQEQSSTMTGTELYAVEDYIPDFQAAKAAKNMLERKSGQTDGFVCRSTAGRVVRLIQAYDSNTYPQEPEELPAQWRFVWSTDPAKALPFVAISTSPYATGDCCTEGGHVWRSTIDNNVRAPSAYPQGWTDLGEIGSAAGGTVEPIPEPEPEPSNVPDWDGVETGYYFKTGTQFAYQGKLYNVLRDLTKTPGWEPPALLGNFYEEAV